MVAVHEYGAEHVEERRQAKTSTFRAVGRDDMQPKSFEEFEKATTPVATRSFALAWRAWLQQMQEPSPPLFNDCCQEARRFLFLSKIADYASRHSSAQVGRRIA